MKSILAFLKSRLVDHWQTTLTALALLIGYHWYNSGKIDFTSFQEYIVLIPSIILLLAKDFKKKKDEQH